MLRPRAVERSADGDWRANFFFLVRIALHRRRLGAGGDAVAGRPTMSHPGQHSLQRKISCLPSQSSATADRRPEKGDKFSASATLRSERVEDVTARCLRRLGVPLRLPHGYVLGTADSRRSALVPRCHPEADYALILNTWPGRYPGAPERPAPNRETRTPSGNARLPDDLVRIDPVLLGRPPDGILTAVRRPFEGPARGAARAEGNTWRYTRGRGRRPST